MLRIFALLVFLLVSSPAFAARAEGLFLSALEDVPLMPGLVERTQDTFSFDTPEGRIVEAFASGPVERNAVVEFYSGILPQLGWTADGPTAFVRDGERLRLDLTLLGEAPLVVHFSLSPTRAP